MKANRITEQSLRFLSSTILVFSSPYFFARLDSARVRKFHSDCRKIRSSGAAKAMKMPHSQATFSLLECCDKTGPGMTVVRSGGRLARQKGELWFSRETWVSNSASI